MHWKIAGLLKPPPSPIKLSVSHFLPATHFVHTKQLASWTAEIKEATNGRVEFVVYPGQTLLKMADTYEGVTKGIADIGISAFCMSYGRHPLMEVFELAGIEYANATAAAVVAWEGYKKIEALKVPDAKILYLFATGPGSINSTVPIRSLEDLKGFQVQGTGSTATIMNTLGASSINIAAPDLYMSLKKGTLKGCTTPFELLKTFKLAEVVKYVTPMPGIYNKVFFVAMNLKKWKALPPDIQKTFDQVNDKWSEKAGKIWTSNMQSALDWAVKNHGTEVIELSSEEHSRWMERLKPIQEKFIADMEAKGLPGREAVEETQRLCEEINKKYK